MVNIESWYLLKFEEYYIKCMVLNFSTSHFRLLKFSNVEWSYEWWKILEWRWMYCGRQVHIGFCKTGVIRTKPETNPECPLYKRTDFIRKVEICWIHKQVVPLGQQVCVWVSKWKINVSKCQPPPLLQKQNLTITENIAKNHVGPYFRGWVLRNKKKIPKRL